MVDTGWGGEFAAQVRSGDKTQTIRREHRRRPIRVGDTLYLYTGMRGPNCRKLKTVVCRKVRDFAVDENGQFWVDGTAISAREAFAERDGFRADETMGAEKMVEFFRQQYRLPFYGVLIRW